MSHALIRPVPPTDSLPATPAAERGATVPTPSPTATTPGPDALARLARLLGGQAAAEMWASALSQNVAEDA